MTSKKRKTETDEITSTEFIKRVYKKALSEAVELYILCTDGHTVKTTALWCYWDKDDPNSVLSLIFDAPNPTDPVEYDVSTEFCAEEVIAAIETLKTDVGEAIYTDGRTDALKCTGVMQFLDKIGFEAVNDRIRDKLLFSVFDEHSAKGRKIKLDFLYHYSVRRMAPDNFYRALIRRIAQTLPEFTPLFEENQNYHEVLLERGVYAQICTLKF